MGVLLPARGNAASVLGLASALERALRRSTGEKCMTFGRRKFIIGSVSAGAVGSLLGGCGNDDDGGGEPVAGADARGVPVDTEVFAHGVASADPLATRCCCGPESRWKAMTPCK